MKFKNIHSFQVFDAITEGETVYMLDKETAKCGKVNDMLVENTLKCLRSDTVDRYYFWCKEEKDETV